MAAVVAVGVVLAGCAPGDGGGSTTTAPSSPVAEGPVSPWDLPLEERPPLFDTCTEVSTEVVEAAVGAPVELNHELSESEPGVLDACNWKTDEIGIGVLSVWKSADAYFADRTKDIEDADARISGRTAIRMKDTTGQAIGNCHYVFFTEQGTVMVSVMFLNTLHRFRGEPFTPVCDVLEEVSAPIVDQIPRGNFR